MTIHHFQFPRITMDPDVCFGKPCIRGMRLPVASILSYLSGGMTTDEILKDWPELEAEDLTEALAFAATALEDSFLPLHKAVS
jgi:uncharacterized protein (DUF433 family)